MASTPSASPPARGLPSRRWLPPIAVTHPGLAAVTGIWVAVHVCLALDGWVGQHTVRAWVFLGGETGIRALGVAHLAVAVILTVGAYTRWQTARHGFLASVTLFTLTGILFLTAWVAQLITGPGWTYSGPVGIFNLALAGVSAAAAREHVAVGAGGVPGARVIVLATAAGDTPAAGIDMPARPGTDAAPRTRKAAITVPEQRMPVGGWATG